MPLHRHPGLTLTLVACAVLGLLCCGACRRAAEPAASSSPAVAHPDWPAELTFAMSVNPEDDESVLHNQPFVRLMLKATGIRIKFFTATSYSAVVEAMRAKRIDGMQTGVFSYLLAEKEAGAEAIAVYVSSHVEPAVYDPSLRPDYNGIIVVKKGNGVRTLADLRGRTFNFGDPAGTSDHLVPKTELLKAGIVPDTDVKTRFSGNHASALISLWNGKADAAATADTAMQRIAQGGQVEFCEFPDHQVGRPRSQAEIQAVFDACPVGKLVTIHSAPIPGTPIALRGDLPADLKAIIRASLLSTLQDPAFIREARRWYVDPSIELKLPSLLAYYDSMREMGKLLDLDLSRLK